MKVKTFAYRGELWRGGQPFQGLAALPHNIIREIKQYDEDFELIERQGGEVDAYRVKIYGASDSSDYLVHQFTLNARPGSWILELMNNSDTWKKYGNGSKATKQIIKGFDENDKFMDIYQELKIGELCDSLAREVITYVGKERKSVVLGA